MRSQASLAVPLSIGIIVAAGCAGRPAAPPQAASQDAAAPAVAAAPPAIQQDGISFLGGDGSSIETAVRIHEAKDEVAGVRAERVWINAHYPDFLKIQQALIARDGRHYDAITTKNGSGEIRVFYFDITEFFGKF